MVHKRIKQISNAGLGIGIGVGLASPYATPGSPVYIMDDMRRIYESGKEVFLEEEPEEFCEAPNNPYTIDDDCYSS